MASEKDDAQFIDLGERIKSLRLQRRLSQRKLAKQSGMSAATISLIERNEVSPSASTLLRLSAALKVQITALFEPDGSSIDLHYVVAGHRRYTRFASGLVEDLGAGGLVDAPVVPLLITIDAG